MTDKERDTATDAEATSDTVEFAPEPYGQTPPTPAEASRGIPGWVLPVAVGAAGLVLSVATGIGGFVAGVKASDGFDGARGFGHDMSEESQGQGRSFDGDSPEQDSERGMRGGHGEWDRGGRGAERGHGEGRGRGMHQDEPQGPAENSLAG